MKVIKSGTKKYQIECKKCHSIIEYNEFEIKHRSNTIEEWVTYGVLATWDEIICPVCKSKICFNEKYD